MSILPTEREYLAEEGKIHPQTKKSKVLKYLGYAGFIILNAVILYFTARADFSKEAPVIAVDLLSKNSLLCIGGAVLCVVLVLAAETIKYMLMMRRLRERVSLFVAFETVALGKYYDAITPSGAGGQPFQIWNLHSHGYSAGASSAMTLTTFVTMQFGFVFLALLTFIFNNSVVGVGEIKAVAYIGVFAYSVVPTLIILSAVSERTSSAIVTFFIRLGGKIHIIKNVDEKCEDANKTIKTYSHSLKYIARSKTILIWLFLLSVVYHVAVCSIPFFVIRFFGCNIHFLQSLCMCVYVYASITIVPTPGNSGAAEGSFYILFNQLDTSGLFWAMLIWRFLCYYFFILLGIILYAAKAIKKLIRKKVKTNEK